MGYDDDTCVKKIIIVGLDVMPDDDMVDIAKAIACFRGVRVTALSNPISGPAGYAEGWKAATAIAETRCRGLIETLASGKKTNRHGRC